MRTKPSVWQIGAVILAVTLGGSYVWFRAAQARGPGEGTAAGADAGPATKPASAPGVVMSSSKFTRIATDAQPDPNTTGGGFKLNNSISAEFAVGQDVKAGIINLMPNYNGAAAPAPAPAPATQPATTQSSLPRTVIFGTKSAPIQFRANPNQEPQK